MLIDNLNPLETQLVELEEDIRETIEEIDRQKAVVRHTDNPFERRYAEHVLATYQEHQKVALADHYHLSKRLIETKGE